MEYTNPGSHFLMSTLFIFIIIFLIFLAALYVSATSFWIHRKIRKTISKAITINRSLLSEAYDTEEQKFEAYNRVYNSALFNLRNSFKHSKLEKVEKLVSTELHKQIKSPFSKFFNTTFYYCKAISSLVFLLLCLLFGTIIAEEYKTNPINFSKTAFNNIASSKDEARQQGEQLLREDEILNEKATQDFNNGIESFKQEDYQNAQAYFQQVPKDTPHYTNAQNYLEEIENILFYATVLYPSYAEITKSPEDYKGENVSFSGTIQDISEYKGKSLIVINYVELGHEAASPGDLMILYPKKTDFMKGDLIDIIGEMKGRYLEAENFVGKFLGTKYTYSYSSKTNPNAMPVILASKIGGL